MTTTTSPRRGPWGTTFSGAKYWPEDPRAGDFLIADIAHALANQCRFGGHCREFYSVAQHSVIVSYICAPADALWGLLHDASEAYLVDIPRPVKYSRGMERYTEIERAFMAAICEQYGLGAEMPTSVHWADEALLALEARDLMPPEAVREWTLNRDAQTGLVGILPVPPVEAEFMFIQRFAQLAPAVTR
jgi:uncharacterized protein